MSFLKYKAAIEEGDTVIICRVKAQGIGCIMSSLFCREERD